MCLSSDALLQHLPSYLGVSLILDMGYLFTAAAAKRSRCSLPWTRDVSSLPPLLTLNLEQLLSAAPDLGLGVSLHGCFSKAQPLLLTLDEGYLLTATLPDLQCGMAPLGLPVPTQPPLLRRGVPPPSH